MERHPFLEGLSRHRGAPPTILVIFGASGDLTARKLIPAIYNLALDSLLPGDFHLIGFGRKAVSDEDFRSLARESLETYSRRPMDEGPWSTVENCLHYHAGGYDDPEAYSSLKEKIDSIREGTERDVQMVFYISTPPSVFEPIVENLGHCGLADHRMGEKIGAKVIIEKPFGRDLESARELNAVLNRHFEESQVFRIDHYLGKETVQNLLVARFANTIFEPIWNRRYIDAVQITVAESVGVGSRGGYYDTSGALRDMIQNHAMQLLSLIAMEPPVSLDPESIRDEKVKVLKAIRPLAMDASMPAAIRGRYQKGHIDGKPVKGYLEEEGIPDESTADTFAALRLFIDSWRWQGIPFYMRSGKRMARRVSEIAIQFKRPPGILFSEESKFDIVPNTLVIQVQPDEGMTLLTNSKVPGLETRTQPVKMHFRYAATFGSNTPEAYERLILDAIVGDSTLFIRGDETEASWKLITPVHEAWEKAGGHAVHNYAAGSWGPDAADALAGQLNHQWRQPGI